MLIYADQGTVGPSDLIYADTQIQWDGLLMGVDTFFGYKSLTGWDDLPALDLADVPRPHQHGEFLGSALAQPRIISFEAQVWGTHASDGSFAELRKEFLRRFQPTQEELPLAIRQHGETYLAFARVINRAWPINRAFFGGYPVASVQWKATDPRKYSIAEHTIDLAVPESVGGLVYPLDYTTGGGLDYGTTVSGSKSVVNSGLVETPLRFEFVGPLSAPYFLTSDDWTLGFTLPLALGETLIVDARLGTVTLGGIDRYYTLHPLSDLPEDCLAPAGSTSVQFAPASSADEGHVDIFWRDAEM